MVMNSRQPQSLACLEYLPENLTGVTHGASTHGSKLSSNMAGIHHGLGFRDLCRQRCHNIL